MYGLLLEHAEIYQKTISETANNKTLWMGLFAKTCNGTHCSLLQGPVVTVSADNSSMPKWFMQSFQFFTIFFACWCHLLLLHICCWEWKVFGRSSCNHILQSVCESWWINTSKRVRRCFTSWKSWLCCLRFFWIVWAIFQWYTAILIFLPNFVWSSHS